MSVNQFLDKSGLKTLVSHIKDAKVNSVSITSYALLRSFLDENLGSNVTKYSEVYLGSDSKFYRVFYSGSSAKSTWRFEVANSFDPASDLDSWSPVKQEEIPADLYLVSSEVSTKNLSDLKDSVESSLRSHERQLSSLASIYGDSAYQQAVLKSPYAVSGIKYGHLEGFLRSGRAPRKVVVIGNTMTTHSYNDTYWKISDNREMGASTPTTGWVSQVYRKLHELYPDILMYKCPGGIWERSTLGSRSFDSILSSSMFLMTPDGCIPTTLTLDEVLDASVDIVICQLYESIGALDLSSVSSSDRTNAVISYIGSLQTDYERLYLSFKSRCPNAWLYQFPGFQQNWYKHHACFKACLSEGVEFCYQPSLNPYHTGLGTSYPSGISLREDQSLHSQLECKVDDPIYDGSGNKIYSVISPVNGHPNDYGFAIMAKTVLYHLFNRVPLEGPSSQIIPTFTYSPYWYDSTNQSVQPNPLDCKSYVDGKHASRDSDGTVTLLQDSSILIDNLDFGYPNETLDNVQLWDDIPDSNGNLSKTPYNTAFNYFTIPGIYYIVPNTHTNVFACLQVTRSTSYGVDNCYCHQLIRSFNPHLGEWSRETILNVIYAGFSPWASLSDSFIRPEPGKLCTYALKRFHSTDVIKRSVFIPKKSITLKHDTGTTLDISFPSVPSSILRCGFYSHHQDDSGTTSDWHDIRLFDVQSAIWVASVEPTLTLDPSKILIIDWF